jgi:hypothetical protein
LIAIHSDSELAYRALHEQGRKINANVESRTKSGPGLYPIYVVLDPRCQGSARSEHAAIFSEAGLVWQPGNWQPGETGGWAGEVDYPTLAVISTLGGVQMIWKWLTPAA